MKLDRAGVGLPTWFDKLTMTPNAQIAVMNVEEYNYREYAHIKRFVPDMTNREKA